MKSISLLILLFVLACCTSHAQSIKPGQSQSLQEPKDLVTDLQSILKDSPLKLYQGVPSWSEEIGARASHDKVFSGSAYIVFDDTTGTTSADEHLAEKVCNGLLRLYYPDLSEEGGSSDNQRSPSTASQSGSACLVWSDIHDDTHTEKISLRVQVVQLREKQIGFILTFVHIPRAAKPAA